MASTYRGNAGHYGRRRPDEGVPTEFRELLARCLSDYGITQSMAASYFGFKNASDLNKRLNRQDNKNMPWMPTARQIIAFCEGFQIPKSMQWKLMLATGFLEGIDLSAAEFQRPGYSKEIQTNLDLLAAWKLMHHDVQDALIGGVRLRQEITICQSIQNKIHCNMIISAWKNGCDVSMKKLKETITLLKPLHREESVRDVDRYLSYLLETPDLSELLASVSLNDYYVLLPFQRLADDYTVLLDSLLKFTDKEIIRLTDELNVALNRETE